MLQFLPVEDFQPFLTSKENRSNRNCSQWLIIIHENTCCVQVEFFDSISTTNVLKVFFFCIIVLGGDGGLYLKTSPNKTEAKWWKVIYFFLFLWRDPLKTDAEWWTGGSYSWMSKVENLKVINSIFKLRQVYFQHHPVELKQICCEATVTYETTAGITSPRDSRDKSGGLCGWVWVCAWVGARWKCTHTHLSVLHLILQRKQHLRGGSSRILSTSSSIWDTSFASGCICTTASFWLDDSIEENTLRDVSQVSFHLFSSVRSAAVLGAFHQVDATCSDLPHQPENEKLFF